MVCLAGVRDISENANHIFVFFICLYIYLSTNNNNIICLNNKDTRMTSMMSFWCLVFNFEHISHHFLVFLLLILGKFTNLEIPENLAFFCSVHNNPYYENSQIPFVPKHSTFIIFC